MSRIRRTPATANISADDDRVVISRSAGEGPCILWWREIDEVRAFKRDLLTVDEICLAFRVGDAWHEVSEQDDGFVPLVERMLALFPSIPKDWHAEVMLPPFAANHRTLWKRDSV